MKMTKRVAIGTLIALGSYLALCALLALLLTRGVLPEGGTRAWTNAFACAASFAGAMTASRGAGKRMVPASLCAAAFWCVVMLLGMLPDEGVEPGRAAALAAAILLGGALSVPARGGKKRGRAGGGRKRHLRK